MRLAQRMSVRWDLIETVTQNSVKLISFLSKDLTVMKERRRSPFEEFFKGSLFEGFEELFKAGEFEGGYSISVVQSGGKTHVNVKAGKGVDIAKLKEDLRRQYPRAEIVIEGEEPLVREVSEKEEKRPLRPHERREKKPLIREID